MSELASASPVTSLDGDLARVHLDYRRAAQARLAWPQCATAAVFFILGFIHASWSANVPAVRDAFGLSPIEVSFTMLALAGGGIFATFYLGPWLTGVGTRTAYKIAGCGLAVSATMILAMPTYWSMLACLVAFGLFAATVDIAMNAEASHIEKRLDKPIMSRLHGVCSVGGVVGGAVGGAAIRLGIAPSAHMAGAAIFSVAILFIARSFTLPHSATQQAATPARVGNATPRCLWLLGGIAFTGLVAEGAMYNWSTIYMRDVVHAAPAFASAGYVVFCGGLAAARFSGDLLRKHFGSARLIRAGGLLACAGMLVALVASGSVFVVLGFAATGFGLANVMPVVFAAAARVKGTSAAQALARVAGLGYVGILLGPVTIGGITQFTGLSAAMSIVALCSALIALIAPPVLRDLL